MDDFDFNVSQNGNIDAFQGDQNINLEQTNDNNQSTDNDKNDSSFGKPEKVQEKPNTSGVINMPKQEGNQNQNIDISNEPEIMKSTLDENISTTLKRDLYAILTKIKYVVVPKMTERKLEELYNWDLWGPLLFCFLYSIALSTGDNTNNENSIFVLIFIIFWIGGFVITFNARFLGASIGICQMISLLGYGMFPINVAGIIIGFCSIRNILLKLIFVIIGLVWSCLASIPWSVNQLAQDAGRYLLHHAVVYTLLTTIMAATVGLLLYLSTPRALLTSIPRIMSTT